jgi:hypothetical protein
VEIMSVVRTIYKYATLGQDTRSLGNLRILLDLQRNISIVTPGEIDKNMYKSDLYTNV